MTDLRITQFWGGPLGIQKSNVFAFLEDLFTSCQFVVRMLKRGGNTIFVVGRRTVAGHELKLDRFVTEAMTGLGCKLAKKHKREIAGKMTPFVIDRAGHSRKDYVKYRYVPTIRQEYVLIFRKC